jgi:hypothetical protein
MLVLFRVSPCDPARIAAMLPAPRSVSIETFSESRDNEVARRRKVLAAAALWGACAWFLSLDVDFLLTHLRNAPQWLLQGSRALFMGSSVAIGYVVYRKYLIEIKSRSQKYAEIREQIRRLLAELLTTPDEDLIRQLQRTIKRIESVLKQYDPEAVRQESERKKPKVA